MGDLIATIDVAALDEFRATGPRYGVTHTNTNNCNWHHEEPGVEFAKPRPTTTQYTRCIEEQDDHRPFVFGVDEVDGKFEVGNGGMQDFRVGLTTVELMTKYFLAAKQAHIFHRWKSYPTP
ncbi:hypothetical protein AeRB84_006640 [Aphanomyces euteiches]|nr:hypothetical protein AeRB84_006640 [Aphanomyces euteiches]